MSKCPSRFTLVEWKTGDLSTESMESISAHVGQCSTCNHESLKIDTNVAEYNSRADEHLADLKSHISALDSNIEIPVPTSMRPHRRSGRRKAAFALVAIAAAAAFVLFFNHNFLLNSYENSPKNSFKGTATFEVIAKRGEHQFRVNPGEKLRTDDALRFVVTTSDAGYLSVFSIDYLGRISPFYPSSSPTVDKKPMEILQYGQRELPGSIVLDDVVGMETYVMVFSKQPFDRAEVHGLVKQLKDQKPNTPLKDDNLGMLQLRVLWVEKTP